jgi:Polysaccharide biosynthesis/export protein
LSKLRGRLKNKLGAKGAVMKGPRIRLWVLLIAVAIIAGLLGWGRRQARTLLYIPDIVAVEVRPALPGRPIAGERLVRPDGTISLGYYGMVSVAGLTPEEAGTKIATHLRRYVSDEPQCVSVRITKSNSAPGFLGRAVRYIRQKVAQL